MPYSLTRAYNNAISDRYNTPGYCLQQVRQWWGVGPKYATAIQAWYGSRTKHTTGTPPKGAPVFWSGGKYGHVAFSLGNGYVRSTDAGGRGRVATVPISWFARNWGYRYVGWTRDLNGVALPVATTAPSIPRVDLSTLIYAATRDADGYKSGTLLVQKALAKTVGLNYSSGPGIYGPATKDAYARWQRSLGYTGAGADGIPGATSLTTLGRRTGLFSVVP